jgi:AcrR family transcriptional regulator
MTITDSTELPTYAGRWPDIHEASLTLFSHLGYHGTTMKHVARELGIQAPSLYNHIVSKQEILSRLILTGMNRMVAVQDEALTGSESASDQLRAMTKAHVMIHINHRRSAMIGDRELQNLEEPALSQVTVQRDRYESRFREVITRGAAEGVFSVHSPKLTSFAIIEMASSVSVWFKEDGELSAEEVADEYGLMALRIAGDRSEF